MCPSACPSGPPLEGRLAYTAHMIASTGVTAAIITVAAGALVGAGATKQSQPVPIRIRVRRGIQAIRRR